MKWTYAEYFLGIGAPGKAIHRVTARHGDEAEFVYGFEIDKYARNAFCAIHGVNEDKIYHDVTDQPDQLPYVDVIFYSPPCQTFSLAGKREGTTVDKGNLFYAALQGIKKSKPKYAIMENVANLKNEFADDFYNMCKALSQEGYISYAKVLSSKDYTIPQNRPRIFIVSVRKDLYEKGQRFEFPIAKKLVYKLKDLLEENVDEKYFLSQEILSRFKYKPAGENVVGTTAPESRSIGQRDIVYDSESYIGALTATDYKQPKQILVNSATAKGYEEAMEGDSINLEHPNSKTRRGRVGKQCAQTLTTSCNQGYFDGKTIRKLTPLECFRLQGFDDEDYYKAVAAYDVKWKSGASDSQMYKRAGNSITVQVEEEMLENLLYQRKEVGAQLSLL